MSSRPMLLPALAGLPLLAAGAAAQLVFDEPEITSSYAGEVFRQSRLHVADLDGDDVLDLVVCDGPLGTASLFTHLGQGDGTFETFVQAPLVGYEPVAVADVTGDAIPDVFAVTDELVLLPGVGDGTLDAPRPVIGPIPKSLFVADVDGDGIPDLVSSGGTLDSTYSVWIGTGSDTWDPWWSVLKSPFDGWSCALGDLDGDGAPELAHGYSFSGAQVFWGLDGGPVAPVQTTYVLGGFSPVLDVALHDVDLDGDLDLIVSKWDGVWILRNDDGALSVLTTVGSTTSAQSAAVGDADEDGRPDLFLGADDELLARKGFGPSSYSEPVHVSHLPDALHLRLADVDGAGPPDVLASTRVQVDQGEVWTYEVRLVRGRTYASDAPFVDLGHALPGEQGWPILLAGGDMLPGGTWALALRNARPSGTAALVVGLEAAYAPFRLGTLVPSPDLLVFGLPLDAEGDLPAGGVWTGGPSGLTFHAQWWVADPAGPLGWSASTGVRVELP